MTNLILYVVMVVVSMLVIWSMSKTKMTGEFLIMKGICLILLTFVMVFALCETIISLLEIT